MVVDGTAAMLKKEIDAPTPWRLDRVGYDPDDRARALRARFAKISEAKFRPKRFDGLSGLLLKAIFIGLLLGAVCGGLLSLSPWPPLATLKHFASVQNCDAARAFGVAPARVGQPGYWASHDADNDGIACEPYYGRP